MIKLKASTVICIFLTTAIQGYSQEPESEVVITSQDTLSSVINVDTLSYLIHEKKDSVTPDSFLLSATDSLVRDSLIASADSLITEQGKSYALSISMVGDVMLGTDYPSSNYLPPGNNCWPLLEPVADMISDADIRFCNIEGVFAGKLGKPKYCRDPKTCYVFRMPEEYISCITEAGFNLASVANNHVNDFGSEGRSNTKKVLNTAGINFAGFADVPYTIFKSDTLLIGFCAFSPNNGVLDLRDIPTAERIVKFLADTCNVVIVSMHGGAEGSKYQHVTRQTEVYLGANRGNVYEFAHRMIDVGADVIIGHGPHVTRAMEIYKNRIIAYSLGNFATYARFNLSGPNGIAPIVNIKINASGEFISGQIHATYQSGEGGAKPDPQKRVITKMQDLMQLDFPEGKLTLSNTGLLNYKAD